MAEKAGELDHVVIEPANVVVVQRTTQKFTAKCFDKDNKRVTRVKCKWSATANIGKIDEKGVFTALTVGVGKVSCECSKGKITKGADTTVTVVTPGFPRAPAPEREIEHAVPTDGKPSLEPSPAGPFPIEPSPQPTPPPGPGPKQKQ